MKFCFYFQINCCFQLVAFLNIFLDISFRFLFELMKMKWIWIVYYFLFISFSIGDLNHINCQNTHTQSYKHSWKKHLLNKFVNSFFFFFVDVYPLIFVSHLAIPGQTCITHFYVIELSTTKKMANQTFRIFLSSGKQKKMVIFKLNISLSIFNKTKKKRDKKQKKNTCNLNKK